MLGRTCLWPLRRFASVDPARDGWNLYAYVGNNPINRIDPDGRADKRTDKDLEILEDPDVLAASGEIAEMSNFDKSFDERLEFATIIFEEEQGINATKVFTSGSQTSVDFQFTAGGKKTTDGKLVVATIHSHPGTRLLEPGNPSSRRAIGGRSSGVCTKDGCTADKRVGEVTGSPVYILNAESNLIKYDPIERRDIRILTGKDYDDYLARAKQAMEARRQ